MWEVQTQPFWHLPSGDNCPYFAEGEIEVPKVTWENYIEEPAPRQKNSTGERDLDLSQPKPVGSGIV